MATVILLPPSQGKAEGGNGPPWERAQTVFPHLVGERRQVRDAVRAALRGGGAAERLLDARGEHLARALADWDALDTARTLPAAERYRGVVWEALAPATLSPAARRLLGRRVLVPSGLWGLLAARDAVPPYRLAMGASPTRPRPALVVVAAPGDPGRRAPRGRRVDHRHAAGGARRPPSTRPGSAGRA